MQYHVLNLGAGVQSTTVYLLSMEGRVPRFDKAIFADTQEEPQAVYAHLAWLQELGGPPIWVRTRGKLGDDLARGRNGSGQNWPASIPAFTLSSDGSQGITRRQCSKEYKTEVVVRAIRRELLGLKPRQRWPKEAWLTQYFGISVDEGARALRIAERVKEQPHCSAAFPLLDIGWTRRDCEKYLAHRVPHTVVKSACVFCPYHTDHEWLRLKHQDPQAWQRSLEVDAAIRDADSKLRRAHSQPLFLHRSCKPLAEVNLNEGQFSLGFIRECEGVCGV